VQSKETVVFFFSEPPHQLILTGPNQTKPNQTISFGLVWFGLVLCIFFFYDHFVPEQISDLSLFTIGPVQPLRSDRFTIALSLIC